MSEQAPSPWDPQPGEPRPEGPQQPLVPPGAFPPPPGTQYGGVQYGSAPFPPMYGQFGPGPYGYGVGIYNRPPGTNGMAIASLILGICGFFCVTPFIGLGLGIPALIQTSKTGQAGKGMAIAGVILSAAWILLGALLIATGHFHSTDGGPSTTPTQAPDGTSA